jgi:NDP-sugar pyrophosphorylase family protein
VYARTDSLLHVGILGSSTLVWSEIQIPLITNSNSQVEGIKAVLLVGGMGTRLRSVAPSTPKPLVSVGEKPFLDLLARQLAYQGIRRLIMCTGYLSDQIESEFGDGHSRDVAIEYSKELQPAGTAGAVKLAQHLLRDCPEFIVMNGDSFLEIDFQKLIQFHREHKGLASMAVRQVKNASRYGTVKTDARGRVMAFLEKTGSDASGIINAGIYVFNRAVFEHIPEGPVSMEREVFPKLLEHGMYALEQHGMFIDIGTPEDYSLAQQICDRLFDAAFHTQQSGS